MTLAINDSYLQNRMLFQIEMFIILVVHPFFIFVSYLSLFFFKKKKKLGRVNKLIRLERGTYYFKSTMSGSFDSTHIFNRYHTI